MRSTPWLHCSAIVALIAGRIFQQSHKRTAIAVRRGTPSLPLCGAVPLIMLCAAALANGQAAHPVSGKESIGSGFSEPLHLAVDASGDVFVSDAENIAIYEIVAVNGIIPPSPTIRSLYRPSANPQGIAVDARGNVYFTTLDGSGNLGNNSVTELLAVNGVIPSLPVVRQLGNGLSYPNTIAVDQYGNVFVSDSDHNLIKEFVAVDGSVPASPTILTLGSGFSDPRGIAVDGAGNVYVSDFGNRQVKEILAANGSIPTSPTIDTLGSGFCAPWDIALDSTGDIFVADYCNAAIFELPAVNGVVQPNTTQLAVASKISGVEGVAVGPYGTIYAGNVASEITAFIPSGSAFGSVNLGSTSSTIPETFLVDTGGTLGPVSVLTAGAPDMDFANAGTGTCTPNATYTAGETCSVNVTFTPRFAGARNGAVELNDTNGNVIATAYIQGTGVGPQLSFSPGTQTTLGSGFDFAAGVAVDGSGNAYVVDIINNLGNVQEIMAVNGRIPANPTIRTLVGGLDCPIGPALDAAGDVYFADVCNHTVSEIQAVGGSIPASPAVRILTGQFVSPAGITVDGSGNVYVLDASNNTVNEIYAVNGTIPASPTIATLANGFKEVDGLAVDGSGNLYVSDDTSRAVFEIQSVNGSIPASPVITSLGSGFVLPRGIAVDAAGNVYVAEYFHDTVYELLAVNGSVPASPAIQTLGTGLQSPNGVAVDGSRNVFVADYGDGRLVQLDYADPPSLTFANTPVGATSTDSPQTVTTENSGNAGLSFPVPATGANPTIGADFALNDNAPNACPVLNSSSSIAGTLAPGATCALSISFAPTAAGILNESLALTDNNLNAASPNYATQSIALNGTSLPSTPSITWANPAPITYGTPLSAAQLDAAASVSGTFTYSPAAGALLTAGTQTLTVTFTPADSTDYTTTSAVVTLTVNQAPTSIAWTAPASIAYGTALSSTQLNASGSVPGTITYSPAAGAVLASGTQTLTALFTPTDSTDYLTAQTSVSLTVNKATPTITWPAPTAIVYGAALGANQLDSTANVPGTFAYSPAAGTVLTAGTQMLSVTFTPTDSSDYSSVTATVPITVTKATPALTWPTPASITAGTPLSSAQLDASASVPGTFVYSPASGAVLTAGSQTLTAAFTPSNSADYNSATASVILQVTAGTPSFTLSPSAGSLSFNQGTTAADTLTVTAQNGFSSKVTLSASGLPTGVTVAYSANPTSGSSALTFTASGSATPGTYAVTIKGVSGSLSASTTISLTIQSGFACHVGYSITNYWGGNSFEVALSIGNTGTATIKNWTLTWTYANGQQVTEIWNANESQSGANVSVTNLSYNGSIAPGASYTGVGLNASWNGKTNAVPTSFAINGTTCH
jgi:sugar lactone lactonase YvrE